MGLTGFSWARPEGPGLANIKRAWLCVSVMRFPPTIKAGVDGGGKSRGIDLPTLRGKDPSITQD